MEIALSENLKSAKNLNFQILQISRNLNESKKISIKPKENHFQFFMLGGFSRSKPFLKRPH